MNEIINYAHQKPIPTYYSNSIFPVIVKVARQYNVGFKEVIVRGRCEVFVNNEQVAEIRPEEMCDADWDLE